MFSTPAAFLINLRSQFLPKRRLFRCILGLGGAWIGIPSEFATTPVVLPATGVALIRHAPDIRGTVDGSLQMMTAENVSLTASEGSSHGEEDENEKSKTVPTITGNLLVPGTPTLEIDPRSTFGGTIPGSGSALPSNYRVSVKGAVTLGHLLTRTDRVVLPPVSAPPAPAGTRDVQLGGNEEGEGQATLAVGVGDFSTLRNLTLKEKAGLVTIPAGTYGVFSAQDKTGFVLGVAGATQPTVYNFQQLRLDQESQLQIVGPVIVTLGQGFKWEGSAGNAAHPEWLVLRVYVKPLTANNGDGNHEGENNQNSGTKKEDIENDDEDADEQDQNDGARITFDHRTTFYGYLTAPTSAVTLAKNCQFIGGLTAHRLTVKATGLLRLQNQTPSVSLTAPTDNAHFLPAAAISCAATAGDPDGYISKVEFFQGAVLLGTGTPSSTTPGAFLFSLTSGLPSGTYTLTAKATDNAGAATVSSSVSILVDAPPTVTLSAPANHAVIAAGSAVTLSATAADSDGSITQVDFYRGTTLLGTGTLSATTPGLYLLPLPAGFAEGSYTLTAAATDNVGLTATSPPIAILVDIAPTITLNAPLNLAVFAAPATITLSATAADSDGTIAQVEFFQGGTSLGLGTAVSGQLGLFTRVVSNLSPGSYVFSATATDDVGLQTISAAISVIADAPPTVSFSAPATGTIIAGGTGFALAASAADSDGTVSKVEFYDGATLLGIGTPDAATPGSFRLSLATGLPLGNHSLTAKATDNVEFSVTSTPAVTLLVDAAPTVTLSSPASGTIVAPSTALTLSATAADIDGTIAKVDFYNGAVLLGTGTPSSTTPGTFVLSLTAGLPSGTYSLTARATDNVGLATTSAPAVTLLVDAAPTVTLSSPTNGAIVAPNAALTLSATAADTDGTIAKVEFYNGTTLLGTSTVSSAGQPGVYVLSLSFGLSAGSYTITAVATDNTGLSATSPSAVLTVKSNGPNVTLTSPASGITIPGSSAVNIVAVATSSRGTITSVIFFDGISRLGVGVLSASQASTYVLPLSCGLAGGTYTITALATDSTGATATSAPHTVTVTATGTVLEIMMPTNGQTVMYSRPGLGAHFAGGPKVQPDSFHIFLDGRDFTSEAMIECGEIMFMPLFDFAEGRHTYRIDWLNNGQIIASDNSTFTVNSIIATGGTFFQGEVRAPTGEPLVGVRVLAADQTAYTDTSGRFAFTNLPAGQTVFHFQTDAVTNPGKYTPVNLAFTVVDNKRVRWDRPIYLIGYDPSQGTLVQSASPMDQVLINPNVPGVALTIPANTKIIFPDGTDHGVVTIVDVPVDRAPNCLGPGFRPGRLISIQPEGALLSQPATITMPNDYNLPAGTVLEMSSLNVQTGQFAVAGVGTVDNNGNLTTSPGSGITTFDWHCLHPRALQNTGLQSSQSGPQNDREIVCSSMSVLEGALEEDHQIPTYRSIGANRAVTLHYNSRVASPDILVSTIIKQNPRDLFPPMFQLSLASPLGGSSNVYDTSKLTASSPSSFSASARMDIRGIHSGTNSITVRKTSYYKNPLDPSGYSQISSQTAVLASHINGSELYPALGAGWAIGNTDRLSFSTSDGSIALIGGADASIRNYSVSGLTSDRTTTSNLGFELGNLNGLGATYYPDNVPTAITSLGFIKPTEGKFMGYFPISKSTPLASAFSGMYPIFLSLPRGTVRASLDVDVLANALIDNKYNDYVTVDYNGIIPRDGFTSRFNPTLPGGDTGYQYHTGWQKIIIDIPSSTWTTGYIQGFDIFLFNTNFVVTTDVALLVDNIKFEIDPTFTTSSLSLTYYAPDLGDFSTFAFDSASKHFIRTLKDGSVETFDQQGREISLTDRLGNTTAYAYTDAAGIGQAFDLAKIIDPAGLVTNFSYLGGKLATVSDPAGRSTHFTYNLSGQLTQITNPDGSTRAFTYDVDGKMLSQSDGLGQTRHYTYGPSGRVAQVQRADGTVYAYAPALTAGFPSAGQGTFAAPAPVLPTLPGYFTVDGNGHTRSKQLNVFGEATSITDALGQQANITYDDFRNPNSVTEPNGNITQLAYDTLGNLSGLKQAFNGATFSFTYTQNFSLLQTATDPLGRTTNYSYDALGNLTKITDPLNQTVVMTYDPKGQVLSRTDQRGKTTTFTYDLSGRLTSITDPINRIALYTYDSAGNITVVTDPMGHVTSFTYDLNGKVTSIVTADGGTTRFVYDGNKDLVSRTDALSHTTTWTYDVRQRRATMTDPLGRVTKYGYDAVDNLVSMTDPAGKLWAYTFDALNRKTSSIDPLGHVTKYAYDAVGNVTKVTRPDGTAIVYNYDLLSRLTSTTSPDGATTTNLYDLANQLDAVGDPLNGVVTFTRDLLGRKISEADQLNRTTQWVYDQTNNLLSLQRPDGTITSYGYDDANRPVQVTAADSGLVSYVYDGDNNLVSLTDSNGKTRQFGYDVVNRRTSETDPLGFSHQFNYDLAGNLVTLKRKDGLAISYTYDSLNRPVQKFLPAVGSLPSDNVKLDYDILGNLASASDNDSQILNTYDERSLIKSTQATFGGNAQTLNYTYDALNRRVGLNDVLGGTSYLYDVRDRLTQVKDSVGNVFSFNYDALSRTTSMGYPNGVTSSLAYDAASQLLSLVHAKGSTTIASTTYSYDQVGNRKAEAREDGNIRTFAYDPVDRLLSSSSSLPAVQSESFAYDHEGNWTVNGRQYDADNKLSRDGGYTYSYDAEGNLTQKANLTNPADLNRYAYDAENRLVRVTAGPVGAPTSITTYAYDALERRIAKTVNGVVTRYVLDGANVRLELNASGQVTASNVSAGLDKLLERVTGAGTYFLHPDGLGSTIALTDTLGTAVERYRFSSFGSIAVLGTNYAPLSTAPKVPETFAGREWDEEAGLYFNRARYYSPVMGRFISQDPIGLVGGRNLYAYVANNPINAIDPLGLDTYEVNRDLSRFGSSARSRSNPITHTFTLTTNPDGSINHAYSWGNDANLHGWNIDQPLDLKTGADALKNGLAERVGGKTLDPYIQKAYDQLNNKENDHSNWIITSNCKTEACKLIDQARDLRKDDLKNRKPGCK